jgi:tricorn protease-like protein
MFQRSICAEACHRNLAIYLVALAVCFTSSAVLAQNGAGGHTRLLRTPTVSASQIGFAYANNIWVVPRAGGSARRITSFQGQTGNPHFSPDGNWIAFSGEYAGNFDLAQATTGRLGGERAATAEMGTKTVM